MVLKLGTRKSPLALAQAELVRALLTTANPGLDVEIIPMTTTGDKMLAGKLDEIGGKGLFTKELEEGLLRGELDIAVHSAKDMQTNLSDRLMIGCVPVRADARDMLVGKYKSIAELPQGAIVGGASLRRASQLLHKRPDLKIVTLRGNVQTRLKKVEAGEMHATLLAVAGLSRLGIIDQVPGVILETDDILPAVAQGALAIECRADYPETLSLLAPLNHHETQRAITAERAMLRALDGSCRTPIAGYATVQGSEISLTGLLASEDGKCCNIATATGTDADTLGIQVAKRLTTND